MRLVRKLFIIHFHLFFFFRGRRNTAASRFGHRPSFALPHAFDSGISEIFTKYLSRLGLLPSVLGTVVQRTARA
jgi:hypothetical protein